MPAPDAISDFEDLLNTIEQYENNNIDDDVPTPPWVLDMIDDLKTNISNAIDFHRSRPYERAR